MNADRQAYSRYQILCAEREAWLDGETADDDTYYYDGISFWRCEAGGKKRLVPPGGPPRTAGGTRTTAAATSAPRAGRWLRPLSVA